MLKFGFICSAGGSPAFAAIDMAMVAGLYTPENFYVITDRPCGAEEEAKARGIRFQRIVAEGAKEFSSNAAELLKNEAVTLTVMFFSRLVTDDLYDAVPILNMHPSLLPSFKGIGAIKQAVESGALCIGATLHEVTAGADEGAIRAQVHTSLSKHSDETTMAHISYVQKTYLTLLALEACLDVPRPVEVSAFFTQKRITQSASPALENAGFREAFTNFLRTTRVREFSP